MWAFYALLWGIAGCDCFGYYSRRSGVEIHAPMWVVGMAGGLFWLAAFSLLAQHKPKVNNFIAVVMLSCFGGVGGWVALNGESNHFGSGIPYISQAANEIIARGLFSFGAFLCFALALYALKRALRRSE